MYLVSVLQITHVTISRKSSELEQIKYNVKLKVLKLYFEPSSGNHLIKLKILISILKTKFHLSIFTLFVILSPDDKQPWIQVDFKKPKLLSGIITQGEKGGQRWLTKYYISTSFDGKHFTPYANHPGDAIYRKFNGNKDSVNPTRHLFNRNITAQYVRIYPLQWHGSSPSLRFEIVGCNPDIPHAPVTTVTAGPTTTLSPNASFGSPTLTPPMGGTGSPSQTTTQMIIPWSCKFHVCKMLKELIEIHVVSINMYSKYINKRYK